MFESAYAAYLWRGITVFGLLSGSGLELREAERALVLRAGGSITLDESVLADNLIAVHLLGGTLALSESALTGNAEYGVKEDEAGIYALVGNAFSGNGVNYYLRGVTQITLDELNALSGNSGNR